MEAATKKQRNVAIGILIVVLVVLVAVIGAVLWNNSRQQEESSNVNTTTQNETTDGKVSYTGEEGKTALDLLKQNHNVQTQTYDGVGEYVTAIDGTAADNAHFWAFYVNGEMAQVGAGEYQTKNGDQITWQLDEIK